MTVSINGTSGIVFNDASTQNTAATGFGFKNRIINGAMVIDQRNAGASVTALTDGTGAFAVDRFRYGQSGGNAVTLQRVTTAPAGFINSLKVTAGTSSTPSYSQLAQRIEGLNMTDMGFGLSTAQTITLSFWVQSSVTGTYSVSLRNSSADRSYIATYTINSANTWEQKTLTIAGDTTGTWLTDNGVWAYLVWDLKGGGTGTAGSWTASGNTSTSGSTGIVGTSSATFYITGVQLEKGSTATSFDYRPYGTELALCQRYFQMYSGSSITNGFGAGRQTTTTTSRIWIAYPSMRATPTFAYSGTVYLDAPAGVGTLSSVTGQYLGLSSGFCDVAHSAIGAIGYGCGLQIPTGSNSITLSVEL